MRSQTVIEYQEWDAQLSEMAEGCAYDRDLMGGAGELAYRLEALGVSHDDFPRILAQAQATSDSRRMAAALDDVCARYRIGAVEDGLVGGTSGTVVGSYAGALVVAFTN